MHLRREENQQTQKKTLGARQEPSTNSTHIHTCICHKVRMKTIHLWREESQWNQEKTMGARQEPSANSANIHTLHMTQTGTKTSWKDEHSHHFSIPAPQWCLFNIRLIPHCSFAKSYFPKRNQVFKPNCLTVIIRTQSLKPCSGPLLLHDRPVKTPP